jgi:hypothetical protein
MSQENVEVVREAFEIFNRYRETDLSRMHVTKRSRLSPSWRPLTSSTSSRRSGPVRGSTRVSMRTAMSSKGSLRP